MWRPKPSIKNQVNWKVDDKADWKKDNQWGSELDKNFVSNKSDGS